MKGLAFDGLYERLGHSRGTGNPLAVGDWNAEKSPERGFLVFAATRHAM
jgi:hypothetical protein